jgi:hypothetical protein
VKWYGVTKYESRAVEKVFRSERMKVTRQWGKLHNEDINNFLSSPYFIMVIRSVGMRWAYSTNASDDKCVCNSAQKTRRKQTIFMV